MRCVARTAADRRCRRFGDIRVGGHDRPDRVCRQHWRVGYQPFTLPDDVEVDPRIAARAAAVLAEPLTSDRRARPATPEPDASPAAIVRETSCNAKLSPVDYKPARGRSVLPYPIPRAPFVSSTFASIEKTCPSSCPFRRVDGEARGCFADSGFTKRTAWRLNEAARALDSIAVIKEEAAAIDGAFRLGRIPQDGARGGRDLRLHVGGDIQSPAEAQLLAGAAARWRARGGGSAWTYTHSWRSVPRAAWGGISALASCENTDDLAAARAQGYAPALVVDRFPNGAKAWRIGRFRAVPCPAETREAKTCADCRLCLDRDLYRLRIVIVFAVHGPTKAAHRSLAHARGELPSAAEVPKRRYVKSGKYSKRALPVGVYPAHGQPGRFVARLGRGGGDYVHLGTFTSAVEAGAAVEAARDRADQLRGKRALAVVA